MRRTALGLIALSCVLSTSAFGGPIIYRNVTTDTGDTLGYAANGFTQIGDQILLGGTDRLATLAAVQFFSDGAAGTFDTTLRFFNVGSPVGAQIGSFTATGISTPGTPLTGDVINVSFVLGSLLVPDNVIFTVSVANLSAGVDILGLDMFEPPDIGSSNNTFAIGFNGSSFVHTDTTGGSVPGENVYFQLDATSVPEPATGGLAGLAVLAIALVLRRSVHAEERI